MIACSSKTGPPFFRPGIVFAFLGRAAHCFMNSSETVPLRASTRALGDYLRALGVQNVPFNFQIGTWRLLRISRRLEVFELKSAAAAPGSGLGPLPPLPNADGYLLKGLPAPIDPAFTALRPGWISMTLREYPRHLVDLTSSFEDYLAKFSGKTRSTFKRKLRKFEEISGGTLDWKEFRNPEELKTFFPLAREVSAKTYQERLLGQGLPDTPAFREEVFARAARGAVRAYILFLKARPVSYLFLPVEEGTAIYAYLGYDPAYAEHSPGTVLQLHALERMFADPSLTLFDFTEGGGEHKQLFATHTEQCADLLILRPGSGATLIARTHQAFARAEARFASILERLGIKRNLKILMRRLTRSGN
jgi:CelD/BcsL family acetyltransferase involved in cellulose biosynthesis